MDVFADFTACTLLAHSRLFVAWVCYRCVRPTGVLILPPSRAPLGVFFHESICSFMMGFLLSEEAVWAADPPLPAPVAAFPGCQLSLQ